MKHLSLFLVFVCLFSVNVSGQPAPDCLNYGDQLKWVSSMVSPRSYGDLIVHGDLAYYTETADLQVIDISNPQSMQVVGLVTSDALPYRLAMDWPYLDAAARSDGIVVFDVSDPAWPLHVGTIPVAGEVRDVAVGGTHLYAACGDSTLQIFDISIPDLPVPVVGVDTPGFSPIVLSNLLRQYNAGGTVECGEMLLTGGADAMDLPNGNWARWINE